MTIDYIMESLARQRPIEKVCYDLNDSYYRIGVLGHFLMYRQSHVLNGRRCYYLTDGLAQLLGYTGLREMKAMLPSIQYWRKWVSVERLRAAIAKGRNPLKD